MVLRLGEALDLSLRDRNELLIGAGFAAVFPASSLHSVPLAQARKALTFMLTQQEPYPAIVVNRAWDMLMANKAAERLLALLGLPVQNSAGEPPNSAAGPAASRSSSAAMSSTGRPWPFP